MQVDETGQKAGPVEQIDFPTNPRMQLLGLFPSPDGQRVAVGWVIDTGTTHVSILDVASGQLRPLFGEASIDQRVTFLAWSPDSQSVLVLGGTLNPDLGNSAWLVDVNTHQYHDVNIKQIDEVPIITSASFSPDGEMIVYSQTNCYQCGSEIWQISLNNSDRQLLFETSKNRIEDIMWSPDGKYIAFNQWLESDEIAEGELYVMQTTSNESQLLDSVMTGYYDLFRPVWSPNSRQIAFIKNSDNSGIETGLDKLSTNLYIADVFANQIYQLTNFENTEIIKPIWSPDGWQVAFLTNENRLESQFKWQTISVNDQGLKQLGIDETLQEAQSSERDTQSVTLAPQSSLAWLP